MSFIPIVPVLPGATGAGMSFSGLLSGIGSALGLYNQINSQREQADFQRGFAQNKYQWLVGDLRRAGLNPILGLNSASPGTGGASLSMIPYVNPFAEMVNANLASAKQAAEIGLMGAQERKANEDAGVSRVTQTKLLKEVNQVVALVDEIKARTSNLGASTALMGQQVKESAERVKEIAQNIEESKARTGQLTAQTKLTDTEKQKLEKEINTLTLQMEELYNEAEIEKTKFGRYIHFLRRLKEMIPGLNIITGKKFK